jgi:N-acetylglucosamine kinase-like BadF-type ATPase
MTTRDGTTLLLGVDGGNTKSIALLATPEGSIVGSGRAEGSSDIHHVPFGVALARLTEAIEAASDGVPDTVHSVAFGLAGADWPEDIAALEEALRRSWPNAIVVNDAIAALRAAIPAGPGVVIVCGTGATTAARGDDGTTWHASFWQDTQGGQMLGETAVRAIARAELGIGPRTVLTDQVLAAMGEVSVEALLHRLTGRATKGGHAHARLAPIVIAAADDGDRVASGIVRVHGADLGRFAVAAARQVGIDSQSFTLALAGGVLRGDGRAMRAALEREVLDLAPGTHIIDAALEPAAGALLLAFDAARLPVTPEVEERLRETMPGPELFDTSGADVSAGWPR